MTRSIRPILLLLSALLLAAPGCDRAPRSTPAIVQEKSATNIAARVSLDAQAITTAQRATLTIDTTTPPGWDPQVIDLATALPEGLSLAGTLPETRRGGGESPLNLRRQYTIEPFLDGAYTIAPFEIRASRRVVAGQPDNAPAEIASLTTDALTLSVTTVLKEGEAELAEAKSVVDPREPMPWILIALGASALLVGAGVAWWLLTRDRTPVAPPPVMIPAHTLALARLDALLARRLVESGRFEPFYAEASGILRSYIEDRYGVHAPERTTEEFLQESRTSAALMEDDVRVLERFLGHVDLVKFAAVVPSEREAQSVAGTVREFVERTKSLDRLVERPAEAPAGSATGDAGSSASSREIGGGA